MNPPIPDTDIIEITCIFTLPLMSGLTIFYWAITEHLILLINNIVGRSQNHQWWPNVSSFVGIFYVKVCVPKYCKSNVGSTLTSTFSSSTIVIVNIILIPSVVALEQIQW